MLRRVKVADVREVEALEVTCDMCGEVWIQNFLGDMEYEVLPSLETKNGVYHLCDICCEVLVDYITGGKE